MNNQAIQKANSAGHTKLTAVTIYDSPHSRYTVFIPLLHDSRGRAILPHSVFAEVRRRHMAG